MAALERITGHYLSVDNTRIFFDEVGEGTPFIGVHTAGADSREYQYLLPELADRGYRAIAVDLPGHSRSYPVNWKPYNTIHDLAEFVYRFARELLGEEKAVVGGCSIGGCIAFDLAAHHSDAFAAIVAMEGLAWGGPILPVPVEMERPSWSTQWKPFLEYAATDSLGKPTLAKKDKVTELWWQHQNAQQCGNSDIQAWSSHDVRGKLGDVRCPVLVVGGRDDFWVPEELVRQSAAEIGDQAEVRMLDGIGHYPMFEDPGGIAELIDEFVKKRV